MKKTKTIRSAIHCILIFGVTILFVATSSTFAQTGRFENVVVHSQALEGNLLGDSPDRNVSIYLPSAYDSNPGDSFSVIYMLHGFTFTNSTFINYFNLKTIFDNFFSQGTHQPMIIIIPDAFNTYAGSFYTNSIVTGNWEDFITQELVEYVDNNYRTIPHNLSRGISGHSMGGYGAMKLAMKHPEIYSAVYSLSGANLVFEDVILGTMFWALVQAVNATSFNNLPWQAKAMVAAGAAFAPNINTPPFMCDFPIDTNGDVIDSVWQRWLQHDPYSLIESYRENLLQLTITFDCGTYDEYLLGANQNFHLALDAENIPHFYGEYIGDHSNKISERVKLSMLPFFSGILTDVESDHLFLPDELSLFQNYPNPFNPTTTVRYEIPELSFVILKVFDVLGSKVATLVNEEKPTGTYELTWYAGSLPSGIYFYRLQAGSFVETKKMILLK